MSVARLGAVGACLAVVAVALPATAHAATRKPPGGYRIVKTAVLTLPAGSRFHGQVNCPVGTVPWGGGVITESPDPAVNIADSFPDGRTWIVEMNNPTASDTAFQVNAVCAKRPAGYTVVHGTLQLLPALLQGDAVATCPAGTRPLGGGGFSSSGNQAVATNSSGPDGQNWDLAENNGTVITWNLTAVVVCGKPVAYRVVMGQPFAVAALSRLGSEANCPAPFVVSGGGTFIGSEALQANIDGTEPIGRTAWGSFIGNDSASTLTAVPEAICVHS
jgi:hypothetical protein